MFVCRVVKKLKYKYLKYAIKYMACSLICILLSFEMYFVTKIHISA